MGARRVYLPLTLAALLVGAVLFAVVPLLGRPDGPPAAWYLLLLPTVVSVVPLVLALACRLEPGPARPSAADLDHLLTLKRVGGLPPARRPPRRGGRLLPDPRPRTDATPDPLDRLLERKRAWVGPEARRAGDADL